MNQALLHHQSGDLRKAEGIYNKILEFVPDHSNAMHLLGVIYHQTGKIEKAINLINESIKINPENPKYYINLGNALQDGGRFDEGISCYQKALKLNPGFAEAYYNLGSAFQTQNNFKQAISYYKKALDINPDFAEALNNMGSAYQRKDDFKEALSCYQKALKIKPDYASAHYNLGSVFQGLNILPDAVSCYKKALEIKPDYAEAYNNMGNVLENLGNLYEAIECYKKALEIKPDFSEVYYNIGNNYVKQGVEEEAVSCYEKTIQLKPDFTEALCQLVYQLKKACAWQKLKIFEPRLDDLTKNELEKGVKTGEVPFLNNIRRPDSFLNFAVARSWSLDVERRLTSLKIGFSFDSQSRDKTKINVGYLSNDFHDHATAHLMLSLFGLHNRNEFEIFCYSYGKNDNSSYREKIKKDCSKFVDISNMSFVDAAKCIYDDYVDILVDLKGYTKGAMMEICALRPAPVQVSYLGFPGTTGAEFFDYIITDKIVTPEKYSKYYSEKIVYMPHCYQVNDYKQKISEREWKKTDLDLPENCFLLSSFNQSYKIEPAMFYMWMEILLAVPETYLWLYPKSKIAENNLKQEAGIRGVSSERLIFANKLPKPEHLARLKISDLALDTGVCNGHTTTSDALWACVPVITLKGSHFASRVSSSILAAVGLSGLVTNSKEEYKALVLRLIRNPEELAKIRERLAKNRITEPLFDTPRFARNLESAYKKMWEFYLSGESPRQIEILEG